MGLRRAGQMVAFVLSLALALGCWNDRKNSYELEAPDGGQGGLHFQRLQGGSQLLAPMLWHCLDQLGWSKAFSQP